ncbi:hypothetical protein [Burkholderia cenocepacia]|uniref:Uncharacterized protein n=1 Tax=Burkholderia cenocepacia TaxID=95486 RepID=A0A6B2MCE9_9BURK|nr:hypothetical protein [Burkholderia cenocepacia]NDV73518.1 hypothetical protein [Burkholderia cenocepacia]
MSTITDRLYAQARIQPIQSQNRVKSVKKLESGSLAVTLHSGRTYAIAPEGELFQAFVVYTVLNSNT